MMFAAISAPMGRKCAVKEHSRKKWKLVLGEEGTEKSWKKEIYERQVEVR